MYQEKQITKNVYNDIMNSIKLQNRIDTILMNSENRNISYPHRVLLNLSDKIDLRRSDKYVALSNLENMEKYKKIILKYQLRRGAYYF